MPKRSSTRQMIKAKRRRVGNRSTASVVLGRSARLGRLRRRNTAAMGFLGIEKKFYDTAFAGTVSVAVDCTGAEADPSATSMISTPAVGDSEQNRDGKKISCLSVQVTGTCAAGFAEAQANPRAPNKVYLALVLDKQSNAAQLNSEDVFKNLGGTDATNASPFRNLLYSNRFQILKKKVFNLDMLTLSHFAVDSFSAQARSVNFDWFVPLNGLIVNFNSGTTSSIANVIDNSLHLIAFSTGTGTTTTLSYNARLRFVG